jgi:hypothetical protein
VTRTLLLAKREGSRGREWTGRSSSVILPDVCRNIRVLYNFRPPTTKDEIHAAALQYVRKVSGLNAPSLADRAAFDQGVADIAATTERLLASLTAKAPVRTREGEKEKAMFRWKKRESRLRPSS